MGWPKGRKRKVEVMPPGDESSAPADNAQPVSEVETQARVPRMKAVNPNWEKLLPRDPKTIKMKAGNNWENMGERVSNPNRFHIDEDRIPEGMALQWLAVEVYGERQNKRISKFYSEGGWTPVHIEDFDGEFKDYPHDQDGWVIDEGTQLCTRPMAIHMKAKKREEAEARSQIALKEQAFKGGDFGNVTGTDDPSAIAYNRQHGIRRSMERIEVPKD